MARDQPWKLHRERQVRRLVVFFEMRGILRWRIQSENLVHSDCFSLEPDFKFETGIRIRTGCKFQTKNETTFAPSRPRCFALLARSGMATQRCARAHRNPSEASRRNTSTESRRARPCTSLRAYAESSLRAAAT